MAHPIACHCGAPATHQSHRDATPDETAASLKAMDAWRVSQGLGPLPADATIRHHPHEIPVYTCCAHTDGDTCDGAA